MEVKTSRIFSVIVAFNPDENQLATTIARIVSQGAEVVVVNNGETLSSDNYMIINEAENVGIAKAQNDGIRYAVEHGADFVTIFDQDSSVPDSFFEVMLESYKRLNNVGFLVPRVFDTNKKQNVEPKVYKRTGKKVQINQPSITEIEKLKGQKFRLAAVPIASGSFIPVSSFATAGYMNESLFIDSVDTEFAIRILLSGLDIFQLNELVLPHEIGRREKIQISKTIHFWTTNHSPMRRFMMTRNIIVINKMYHNRVIGLQKIMWRTLISTFIYIVFETDKKNKLLAYFKGIKAGLIDFKWKRV